MPKYRVKEKSLIGNTLYEAGEIVDYDGLPAENLEPLDAEGEARYQEYLKSNAERTARLKEQFSESAVGDPAAFAQAVAKANAEANAELMAAMPTMIATAVAQALATAFPNGTAKPAAKPADPPAPPATGDASQA
jgi:hypothetical protein